MSGSRDGRQMLVAHHVIFHAEVVLGLIGLVCMRVEHAVSVFGFASLLQWQVAGLGDHLYLLVLVRLCNRKPYLQRLAGINIADREVVVKNKVPRLGRLRKRSKGK